MTKRVRTDIAPGVSADCRVVAEIDIEGTPHLVVCTREGPEPKIYGLRDEEQVRQVALDTETDDGRG